MTNVTVLTSSHQTQLPAIIRHDSRTNPSAEEFKQQTEQNTHQRNSRRQNDQQDGDRLATVDRQPSRRPGANVSHIRGQRADQDSLDNERRQMSDRRGFGIQAFAQRAVDRAPTLTAVGSGFMAQMIAQEIVPDIARQPGLLSENGVVAYENSVATAELHIDPFNAYAEIA